MQLPKGAKRFPLLREWLIQNLFLEAHMKKLFGSAMVIFALFIFGATSARASSISIDFESPTGYHLFNGAALVTSPYLSPTHSAVLNDPVNDSLVQILPVADYGLHLTLGTTSDSFSVFIPDGSNANLAPYAIFGVDVNGDGVWDSSLTTDALVIAFITGSSPYPTNTWFGTGLNASTMVHVVGARPGLTDGTFSSSGTQDTLAALSGMSTGSGTWGDLGLLRIYTEIGSWPGTTQYTAYVDDINVTGRSTPVPEPASMLLLGTGLAFAGKRLRRKTGA
jgi:hypothetical protein